MKMPEKHDWLRYSRGKGTRHRAILAFAMAYLFAADIMAVRLQKQSNRRNDVRHYRLVHS